MYGIYLIFNNKYLYFFEIIIIIIFVNLVGIEIQLKILKLIKSKG